MGPHPGPELGSKCTCICAPVHDDNLFESLILIGMQILSLLTLVHSNYLLHAHISQTTHTHFIHMYMYIACHRVMPLDLCAEKKNNTRMQSTN